ncbi:MAG: hypothetical protein KDE53_07490 [Caldilineaceae bacterium]|nr:hypothetical protein [Caldilineaceae bacterium]
MQNLDNPVVNDIRYHHLGSTACIEKRRYRGSTGCVHKLNDDSVNVLVVTSDIVLGQYSVPV